MSMNISNERIADNTSYTFREVNRLIRPSALATMPAWPFSALSEMGIGAQRMQSASVYNRAQAESRSRLQPIQDIPWPMPIAHRLVVNK